LVCSLALTGVAETGCAPAAAPVAADASWLVAGLAEAAWLEYPPPWFANGPTLLAVWTWLAEAPTWFVEVPTWLAPERPPLEKPPPHEAAGAAEATEPAVWASPVDRPPAWLWCWPTAS
jgi:hypothetical protein